MDTYRIRTKAFDGPLDLLLSLIEKRKLLINDIALSEVTDDYLKHIEQYPRLPIAETAQFVLVGSTLLLIKSKSLLPVLSLTQEEQSSIEDLEHRLKLLDRYKTISRTLLEVFGVRFLYSRKHSSRKRPEFSPLENMTVDRIAVSMEQVLQNIPKGKPELPKTVVQKVVSLEEMMDTLSARINKSMKVSFRQFSSDVPGGKLNVIVSFLAMLELVRQGVIRVEQESRFDDIHMHADTVGVPRYT